MKKFFKSILLVAITTLVMSGCSESDKTYTAGTPVLQTSELTTTKLVSDINTLATGVGSTPTLYTADDVIEAYVTSNDAAGNFYKSISFQSIPTDASAPIGFSISVDKSMLFVNGFTPGRKVYIKLKGLYYATIFGSMQIGVADATQTTGMSGISKNDLGLYLFPSATIVSEDTMVRHLSLSNAANNANLNTLIEIDNTQFADNSLARTYFDIDSGGFATNHDLVDATLGGTTRFIRISQYAGFSSNSVPAGRGSIRGVMTKYNSDFQFIVRQESDIKLTNPRTYTFFSSLNENFSSYAVGQVAFPNYLDFAKVGTTKKWLIKSGALEMSGYGGALEQNKSYFIVPVDMTAASTFTFNISQAFYNGIALKIYRSTDYVPGNDITKATLYDITTNFNVPAANSTFVNAGVYNIPATVTGNGYFIFEYTGTNISTGPPITTTVDIDNIVVN